MKKISQLTGCPKLLSFEQKQALRKEVRGLLSCLSAAEITAKSEAIWRQVEALEEFRQAATVLLFASLPTEVQSQSFMQRWGSQKRLLLPIVHGDTLLVGAPAALKKSTPFGILEPAQALAKIPPIDVAIIPGVAFDRYNNRLGRGKGYYDRFLNAIHLYKIGVCFSCQLFDRIPHGKRDVKMDRVVNS
ncbi:MAG: 5-formyltetrahydrofolate cyclo-ligase [Prevotellaceae bacterium]|jgi:5-formyltetrahydrofolate cyclo-ligase|nr:5-formyltetrahydrofolate cyclo-ligase [Prevotellaceae bacterium]